MKGVPLAGQLLRCVPLLYNAAEVPAQELPAASGEQERRLCDLCVDGSEGEATHSCKRCSGILLCAKHMVHHARKSVFADHVLERLTDEPQYLAGKGKESSLGAKTQRCLLHRSKDIISFCETCSHAVCENCLASGHKHHVVDTLSSVAGTQKASVARTMVSSTVSLRAITSLVTAVGIEMKEIREEARTASAAVVGAFGHVEAVLREKQQQMLQEIEKTHWRQLEASEVRQQLLYRLEETYTTLELVAKRLAGDDMRDMDAVQVGSVLKKCLRRMESNLLLEQAPRRRAKITAQLSTTAISDSEAAIASVVQVYEGDGYDVTTSTVSVPDQICVREEFSTRVAINVPAGTASPSITATYIAPSTQRYDALVTQTTDLSGHQLILTAQITPLEEGEYTLELRDSADRIKSVTFTSRRRVVVLDPRKCSAGITLSDNNLMATQTGLHRTAASVAARDGYTMGCHSWNVRIPNANAGGLAVGFGVVNLPLNGDYSRVRHFFDAETYYCWWSDGEYGCRPAGRGTDCTRLQDGDTATLTLNCERRTLGLYHHRTNQQWSITEIDCTQALYPAFCMYSTGQQAGLY